LLRHQPQHTIIGDLNMKILLIGATGTIGKAVSALLQTNSHEVVGAAYSGGDYQVDLGS